MSRLLHLCEREVKKVQVKHEELNDTDALQIFLDWSRDDEQRLELLTTVDVQKRIIKQMREK